MNISEEHRKLSQALNILSGGPFTARRMKAREYVCRALVELEAEHFEAIRTAGSHGVPVMSVEIKYCNHGAYGPG